MTYTPNPQHRNNSFASAKSQWSIAISDEIACYNNAQTKHWLANASYWGLHLPTGVPAQLGISPSAQFQLYLAKFVEDQGNWHGYPVAHWLSPFDKPPVSVLKCWQYEGYINKAKLAKIHRGKQCSL